MKWIDVKENLPVKKNENIYSDPVLAYEIDEEVMYIATFVPSENSWYEFYEFPYGKIYDITHWLPLPKFPEIKRKKQMEWISVDHELPKNNEIILALIEGIFIDKSENSINPKKSLKIFEATFNRSIGWNIPFGPDESYPVTHWMPIPKSPYIKE